MTSKSTAHSNDSFEPVKSADRALALLDLFRQWRRPAGAREISEALNMPRSSTTVLLRSLIQSGYLRSELDQNLYFPTLQVFQIGNWMSEGFLADEALTRLLKQIASQTEETVCAWVRVGFIVRVFKVLPSARSIALAIDVGDTAPLFGTAVGAALLSLMDENALSELIASYNESPLGGRRAVKAQVLKEASAVRERGVSIGYDRWLTDASAVAVPLDHTFFGEPIVLAVGGPTFRIKRYEASIEETLLNALSSVRSHMTI